MPRRKQTRQAVLDLPGQTSSADGLAETMSAPAGAPLTVNQTSSTSLNGIVAGEHPNGRSLVPTTQPAASTENPSVAISKSSLSASVTLDLRRRKLAASASQSPADLKPSRSSSRSMETPKITKRRSWLLLALASGTFAALNGAFAKLTTASNTSAITNTLAAILHISITAPNAWYRILDVAIRAFFFALNLISNGIMWALFTRALTAHDSATSVSILNTSANFLVTAAIGALGFSEKLPARWFLGAGFLLVGSVVIGRNANAKEDVPPRDGERSSHAVVDGVGRDGEAVSLLDVDVREEEEEVR